MELQRNDLIVHKLKMQYAYQNYLDFFDQISFPCAVIKGEPLSLQIYGSPGKRMSHDIDLLVSKQYLEQIETVLISKGFSYNNISRTDKITALLASHQAPTLKINNDIFGTIVIDINYDIFWGEYDGTRIGINEFLSDTIRKDIYGIPINILTPVKSFLQLILHHYKEMNSIYHLYHHNCIRVDMFQDIYYLWKNNKKAITLDDVIRKATDYQIVPYIYYMLYYTNVIYKDEELQLFVDAFKSVEGKELLNSYGLSKNERKVWRYSFIQRLETDNLKELIETDLTKFDLDKIKRNRRIFE